ncbi:hypothetical protein GALMADRAFT_140770 [Galerina marginata CBS 339.88]|uniref:lytic cellulose monooxygenase (C4-dehydrogenating) n=1 Tax=Galerina marginata (strain CBS 339.88) TaxID=685588 RepID=A0A067T8B3_GALM3|nr:hypothetical protein GALMADRAFT_140770 [Galerina marginata CBS 339.88]
MSLQVHVYLLLDAICLFSLLHVAFGHGFVYNVVIGGQVYPGWNPFVDPYTTTPAGIVRKVLSDGFVSSSDPDIYVTMVATMGQILLQVHHPDLKSFFNGPILATTKDPYPRIWLLATAIVQISNPQMHAGLRELFLDFQYPDGLAPGQYLMRNEMYSAFLDLESELFLTGLDVLLSIPLHSSDPQFYPSCSQVKVIVTGTSAPSDSELVSMQTLYHDQGVTFPNIYGDSVVFTIPGPPPVDFDGNGGSTSTSRATSMTGFSQAPTSTTPVPTPRPSAQCHLTSRKLLRRKAF